MAYGASPISLPVLEQALAKFPGIAFMQAYGMTETSPVISVSPDWTHQAEGIASGLVRSAGRGGFGGLVKIVDEEGNEVPRGVVGEIIVCGPNVMLGYWNRPEETAKALRNGWLHTGDGAYMDERGFLFIVDRLKDMIVTGGENVYSAEVENVVARHPSVQSCAVIGIPHERWGEAVHAGVVLHAGRDVCSADRRAHCAQHIAGYKCPKSVEFVAALPLSAAGKVLKRDLRAPYWKDQNRAVN
jgi:long-chain acyl-CoA synthetase